MLLRLLLLLTIVPLVELIVLFRVGGAIGPVTTVLMIILTGILGSILARIQGMYTVNKIRERLTRNELPAAEMVDGVLIFAAGLLLLTPGFLTDGVGFLLLVPSARTHIQRWLQTRFKRHVSVFTTESQSRTQRETSANQYEPPHDEGPVIDVEGKTVDSSKDDHP